MMTIADDDNYTETKPLFSLSPLIPEVQIKYKMISVKNCVLFVPLPPTIPPLFFTTHIYITYTHTINPLAATPYNP